MLDGQVLSEVIDIARQAGRRILEVYARGDHGVELKQDNSPLTEADRLANELIVAALAKLTPRVPVLSEESAQVPFAQRKHWQRFWLVDPLDGTREFIKRNGEFTVNIALIEEGRPMMGVVHVPVADQTYSGLVPGEAVAAGAWKQSKDQTAVHIAVSPLRPGQKKLRVVASRSHRDPRLDQLLLRLTTDFPELELVSMGSSLKICLLAEGRADLYPRLAPTSEWDTAAAHAVLVAAGGSLVNTQFVELRYNSKEDLLNPYFIGLADSTIDWRPYFANLSATG